MAANSIASHRKINWGPSVGRIANTCTISGRISNPSYRQILKLFLRRSLGAVLALNLLLIRPLVAAGDPAAELDKALQDACKPAGEADNSPALQLEALVREAKTPEQLRLIEARLVQTLESDAPWSAKQAVCRVLWHIGSARSAPALKKLLAKPQTVDIACYAVSSSRVAELGNAARDALAGSTGQVAVGLLNLLGQRRDAEAVGLIIPFLQNDQPAVALAAAAALGKIGGRPAVTALDAFRKIVSNDRRAVADDAYLRAVETLEAAGAVPLWKALVVAKDERGPVRRAALLGLSEHAPDAAWPWLLAALQAKDPALFPGTGQALRSLRDQPVSLQVAASLPDLPAASQIIVMESLGAALPAETLTTLMERSNDAAVRRSALRNLGAQGGPRVVALLLARVLSPDADGQRREILAILSALPGREATDAILGTLPQAPASLLPDLARLLVARGAEGIAAPLLGRAGAGDTASRLQAVRALRIAAGAGDRAALARLLEGTAQPEVHEAIEQAIGFVLGRCGRADEHAQWLRGELQSARRPRDRQAFVRLLARTGTAAALQTVLAAAREGSAEDRGAALRALTQWPNEAALKPLLDLTGQPLNEAQRVQALHGAVDLLRKSKLPASQKADCFGRLVPLARDPSDRKFLLSGLAEVPDAGALRFIVPWLNDPAVRAEAATAAIAVASKLGADQDAAVNSAMNKVLATVEDAGLRDRAGKMIRTRK